MGLDFSHCDAHWSYGGFSRFRTAIAEQIGLLDYADIKETNDPRFDKIGDDPILPLLAHSDCDGELEPEECASIAPRLRELVKRWPDDDYDKRQALRLAEGMEEAAHLGEKLEFK